MTFAGEVTPPGWFQVCRRCRSLVDYDCACGDTDAAHFDDLEKAKAATRKTSPTNQVKP